MLCTSSLMLALLIAPSAEACLGKPGQKCGNHATAPTDEIKAEVFQLPSLAEGGNAMALKLTHADQSPVTLEQLKTVHTKKIHMLVIDDSLSDYHHLHPDRSEEIGVYHFYFSPKTTHSYRVFVDITPLNSKQRFVRTEIKGMLGCEEPCIKKMDSNIKHEDGLNFVLTFDGELKAGKDSLLHLSITHKEGDKEVPVTNLEPVMGAYAHLVGFYDDRETIAHIHPMGKEPEKESDRGKGELKFHFMPQKSGFVNFFAQVQIDGKMKYIPFGYEVAP